MINLGLKENKCEECGITEWRGKPITIQLHHINGDRSDNRVENLRMLCPNCHS
ncbi:HNH endonuclease [Intestinibacter sp.]|uniref:HNH endonuclease n=1 Tax=Intestinibacter sp. TaxID=1965304 RepID=UPI003F156685